MQTTIPGVVLQSLPSGKTHAIITLFTPLGLFVFFAKEGLSVYSDFRDALLPITLGTYTLAHVPPKMRTLVQAELREPFSAIKSTYSCLDAAGKIIRAILKSQWQEKPAPKLFALFLNFLHRLTASKNPDLFSSTFLIKLLQHEGVLDFSSICAHCKERIVSREFCRFEGRVFCSNHAPETAVLLDYQEERILHALAYARQFQELLDLSEFPVALSEKIQLIFDSAMEQNKVY